MTRNEAPQFSPDRLEQEQVTLDTIKIEQAVELFNGGITVKALETVPEINPEKITQVSVTIRPTEVEGKTETGVMLYWVDQEIGGELFVESSFVPVARCSSSDTGPIVDLAPAFTMDDFGMVDDLSLELIHLREWGMLPNLSEDLLSINEPPTPNFTFDNLDADSF